MDVKGKAKMPPSEDDSPNPKRTRPSSSSGPSSPSGIGAGSVAEGELSMVEFLSRFQPHLTNWIHKEVENALQTHLELLRGRREAGEVAIIGGGIEKFKLVFYNQPASTIFTNSEIQAENGEAVWVAIYDATTNAIVRTGPLSSARIVLVLLDGDYDETNRSLSELKRNILSPREGKRPLLVGDGIKLILENGFASIKCVCITDNSSWMKSKKFRLGVMIIDENILAMYPTIGAAVSQPFRVMDHRGEVNKKHHPPSREDEVWRLEGIGKDGAYHKNLSLHGINTVGDFVLKYDEIGWAALKKLLGTKVPKKTWTMMVQNAFECLSYPDPSLEVNFSTNNVMGDQAFNESVDIFGQNNLDNGYESPGNYFSENFGYGLADGLPSLLTDEAPASYDPAAATTMQVLTPNTINGI
ncbi:calmodulin-binding protein 60 A-like [Cucurbita moschata]|uniref:Calmodulin-binding protein 60 A-like n=1 Tax=Cucurbita moschata TaxID=3662 RepID=A0A6J1HC79_CUCMO|nr:calmodulin-binding protein 60 A-like [Cucurbita moschata]